MTSQILRNKFFFASLELRHGQILPYVSWKRPFFFSENENPDWSCYRASENAQAQLPSAILLPRVSTPHTYVWVLRQGRSLPCLTLCSICFSGAHVAVLPSLQARSVVWLRCTASGRNAIILKVFQLNQCLPNALSQCIYAPSLFCLPLVSLSLCCQLWPPLSVTRKFSTLPGGASVSSGGPVPGKDPAVPSSSPPHSWAGWHFSLNLH